jgi:hypothetical protein
MGGLEHGVTLLAARLRHEAAAIRTTSAFRALERHYRPDQPRVPAGRPEGGQWTRDGIGPSLRRVSEVIYVCTRIGSVPITDEMDRLAYAVSYLCGFDQKVLSWITTKRLKPIIRDPRL